MVQRKQRNKSNQSEKTFDELQQVFKHLKNKNMHEDKISSSEDDSSDLQTLQRAFLRHQEDPTELNFNQFDQRALDLYWESMEAHDLMVFDDASEQDGLYSHEDELSLSLEPTFSDHDNARLGGGDLALDRIVEADELQAIEESFDESSFSLSIAKDQ